MKADIKIKDGKVSIDVSDLFYLLHDAYEDEYDAEKFIDNLGWLPQIRKAVINILKNEYSRKSYNEDVHKERDELLKSMKEKEFEYHTAYIASLIEEKHRWQKNYWKLWHWYKDKLSEYFNIQEFPPNTEEINFDYKKEIERYATELIKNIPQAS